MDLSERLRQASEQIARAFHNEYEARAVEHGWETQERSRVEWDDLPRSNRNLMIATVRALLDKGVIAPGLDQPEPHSHDPEIPTIHGLRYRS